MCFGRWQCPPFNRCLLALMNLVVHSTMHTFVIENQFGKMAGQNGRGNLQKRVLLYFEVVDVVNERYACKIENCKQNFLSGKNLHNLVGHARKQHTEFFQKTFGEFCVDHPEKHSLPYRRLRHIQRCAEIVAVNGNPFTKLNESGTRSLLAKELEILRTCGHGSDLSAPHYTAVKEHINHMRKKIQNDIKSEVRGKYVAVMADSATRHRFSILGVCIQYIHEGQLKIRTIAMANMTQPQTAQNLKNEILKILKTYGIQNNQIISFTSDNASNMIATVRLMNDHSTEDKDDEEEDDENENETGSDDESDDESSGCIFNLGANADTDTSSSESESENSDQLNEANNILSEHNDYEKLLEELCSSFSGESLMIPSVRCAAHTLQLGVKDSIVESDITPILKKCKKVCKLLRKKGTKSILRKHNIRIVVPRLDVITRWNSTHRMVRICVHLKLTLSLNWIEFDLNLVIHCIFLDSIK